MTRRTIRRAATVATAACAAVALSSCGGSDVTYGGAEVANAAEFLATVEATFRGDAGQGETPANLHDDAHCYFSTSTAEGDIADSAFCGPVLHQFGDPAKPYDRYPVSFRSSGDEQSAVLDGEATTGVAIPAGTTLVRPDGQAAPEGAGGLAVPPPPALEPGSVMSLTEEAGDRLTELADGRLTGQSFRFRALGSAELDVIGKGTEQRRAADGEKLVLVRYDYAGTRPESTGTGSSTRVAPPTATLVVDGARTTMNEYIGHGEGQLFAVSVPDDAASVELEISQAGTDQRIDLLTGVRSGDVPAVLYRESADLVTTAEGHTYLSSAVNKTFQLPFRRGDVFDGEYPTQLTVRAMTLGYWADPATPASSPDHAVLQFDVATSGGNTWHGPVDPARVSLVADDGTTYTAVSDNSSDTTVNLINDRYWFEVPATFRGGTITITPGVVIHGGGFGAGATLDYKDTKAEFTVRFR